MIDDLYILKDLINSFFIISMSNYGNGKSLSSIYLSLINSVLNNRHMMLSNTPMFYLSSYDIEFIPLISTSQLTENLTNVQLNLDELQGIANSRDSKSARNSFVTEFSIDVRKFNQSVSATTQYGNTIDVRLYDNSDVIIIPEWKIKQPKNQLRTDFNIYWNILFKETGVNDVILLNLESIKDFYDTTFKPFKIIVNHDEYIEKLNETKGKNYTIEYMSKCNKKIESYEKTYNLIMKGKT